ncbi:hypothetical protein B0G75_104167 [Paraburkholderia sp. BL18I3N2]|nr:hypothetical protein B0G75_104167 [Paraburkholderia sp. BL18I3N2]
MPTEVAADRSARQVWCGSQGLGCDPLYNWPID